MSDLDKLLGQYDAPPIPRDDERQWDRDILLPFARSSTKAVPTDAARWNSVDDVLRSLDARQGHGWQFAVPGFLHDAWNAAKAVSAAPLSGPMMVPSANPDFTESMIGHAGSVVGPMAGVGIGRAAMAPMGRSEIGSSGGRLDPSPLPMDHASRTARAREMGFDTDKTWYHGTRQRKPIRSFDPENIDGSRRRDSDVSSFFTSDPKLANAYSGHMVARDGTPIVGDGGAVYPVHARTDDIPVVRVSDADATTALLQKSNDYADQNNLTTWPRDWGVDDYIGGAFNKMDEQSFRDQFSNALDTLFDGQYIVEGPNGDKLLAIKEGNRVRSPNAAFDPAQSHSANLLASDVTRPQAVNVFKPEGIRAYHGSPHDFDRFDMDKIGTGEGAQAYGHGLYFAENEGVAKRYKQDLGGKAKVSHLDQSHIDKIQPASKIEKLIKSELQDMIYNDGKVSVSDARYIIDDNIKGEQIPIESLGALNEILERHGWANSGRMYEVNIKANPDDFLDWDKPLSQQSEKVRGVFKDFDPAMKAGDAHDLLQQQRHAPKPINTGNPGRDKLMEQMRALEILTGSGRKSISDDLVERGVPGIKYLDQGSRTAGEGSRNYVVFDDKLIEIMRKYGIAGLLAAAYGGTPSEADAAGPQFPSP